MGIKCQNGTEKTFIIVMKGGQMFVVQYQNAKLEFSNANHMPKKQIYDHE